MDSKAQAKEIHFRLELVDLALKLLFRLAGLLVALAARAGFAIAVVVLLGS